MRLLWITAVLTFLLDQGIKWYVVHYLNLETRRAIDVFPPYLNLRMAWNEGVNFGLGEGTSHWLLIGIALAIVVLVLIWVHKETSRLVMFCAGLLVGGAFGNILDRVLYEAVADFLNMSCCGISNPYAFNVADITIFLGAIGLIFFAGKERAEVTTDERPAKRR